jgi:hypothetical protein
MATITTDNDSTIVAKDVKPDHRRRVILPKAIVQKGIRYDIYLNHRGQIILDPRVTIPASEAWVFNNPDVHALVKRGLAEASEGKVSRIDLDTL